MDDRALLALQGPLAQSALARFSPDVASMRFMDVRMLAILGVECMVSRSGYTGEDGFEISVPVAQAQPLARGLLRKSRCRPHRARCPRQPASGSGLCASMAPISMPALRRWKRRLEWAIQKSRRKGGAREGGFPGADVILAQLAAGGDRRRVGLRSKERAPVRGGGELYPDPIADTPIGQVTSGGFGPTVNAPVAMGYVASGCGEAGHCRVRGRSRPAHSLRGERACLSSS